MVGEPANLIPLGALHNLNIKIREQNCHVDLMVAPDKEDALWTKQDRPNEIYKGHGRPYTRHCVKLFATLAAEEQVSLERPRPLTIPDRMRAADSYTMFDTVRPWMTETPTARDHLDAKYDQIALLAFPEGGRGAWTGKVDVDHESKKSRDGEPLPKKKKPTTKLQNVALLKHPRNYGLHLLNFHVMKFGKDKRRGELFDIAPPYIQELWYAKAKKWCKSFRHGKISQLNRDGKVMEDCAVIAVYVTYGVGLWLIDASSSDCQAWDDLKLHWHRQSLSTETNPKKPPNTNKQSDMYGTSLVRRKYPDAPTIDVRVTVADVSTQFVILMLKELVFPVCSVVDRIREIDMLRATPQSPGNEDDKLDSKHPWMLQLLVARLYSHIIHLRGNEQFMHGITIDNKLIPLHTLMSRLGHLLGKKQIAVYLPELLDPVVLKKNKDNYRSYPNND